MPSNADCLTFLIAHVAIQVCEAACQDSLGHVYVLCTVNMFVYTIVCLMLGLDRTLHAFILIL